MKSQPRMNPNRTQKSLEIWNTLGPLDLNKICDDISSCDLFGEDSEYKEKVDGHNIE